jgi:hypothetical protein
MLDRSELRERSVRQAGSPRALTATSGARREWEMQEISRIITSIGAVVASTGLVVYGMGVSYVEADGAMEVTLGLWMMILGVIASVVGLVLYRQSWQEED